MKLGQISQWEFMGRMWAEVLQPLHEIELGHCALKFSNPTSKFVNFSAFWAAEGNARSVPV